MDPKEYAARLQRMQDEIEVAKAREQISGGRNKAMETSPMVDTTERLYAEFKAAKKPAPKKKAPAMKPAEQEAPKQTMVTLRDGKKGAVAADYGVSPEEYDGRGYPRDLGGGLSVVFQDGKRYIVNNNAKTTPPVAQPRASDKPPDEALMAIERMSPEEAMAEWSQIASSTGVTGKKSPRDAAILEALRKKKSLYDDSKAKQAPATPYVPSFLGGKK